MDKFTYLSKDWAVLRKININYPKKIIGILKDHGVNFGLTLVEVIQTFFLHMTLMPELYLSAPNKYQSDTSASLKFYRYILQHFKTQLLPNMCQVLGLIIHIRPVHRPLYSLTIEPAFQDTGGISIGTRLFRGRQLQIIDMQLHNHNGNWGRDDSLWA